MIRTRSPLALLLAATLLVPGEVHMGTGGCLPGSHAVAPAMLEVQTQSPASSHQAASCATHHPGQGPIHGGMQLCSAPGTCPASVALLESRLPLREWQAEVATPSLFPTIPSSRVAPPGTPPPRH
jgi:hypothetical protein